jgi:pyruvate formate lyase activating enzyme
MATSLETTGKGRLVREAILQNRIGKRVRCDVCGRRCLLPEGGRGWCRTRVNRGGRILTLTYGAVSSLEVNPIEKKPLYHFHPGSRALTIGSWSCNFGCPWCQNWQISKTIPSGTADFLAPEDFVHIAQQRACQGTSISFNEPTLSLEWSLEAFRLARARGLYNTFVTNGYMTPEALALLVEAGLDGMNVDIKGDAAALRKYGRGIDVENIWVNCQAARGYGVHLEITTLVIPQVNDGEDVLRGIARRIADGLSPDTPWHLTAYEPRYRHFAPPTPVGTLERAWHWGKEEGLQFVYVGNVAGTSFNHTYCPGCGQVVIQRIGFAQVRSLLRNGKCPSCGLVLPGVWS